MSKAMCAACGEEIDLDAEARQGAGGGQSPDSRSDHENAMLRQAVSLRHYVRDLMACVI
jgi:hypothetical protein